MNFEQFKERIDKKIQKLDKLLKSSKSWDYEVGLDIQTKLEVFKSVKLWLKEVK